MARGLLVVLGVLVGLVGLSPPGIGPARAQPGPGAGVDVVALTPPQRAVPGDFVTAAFEVRNAGAEPDTLLLRVAVSVGLQPLGAPSPSSLVLGAGEAQTVFVTVSVTPRTPAGEGFIALRAVSSADPAISDEDRVVVRIEEVPGLELLPPPERKVEPGETAVLPFRVRNVGNALDRVAFFAESLRGFAATVEPPGLELLPGEERTVRVSLAIPAEAAPGRERLRLRARSVLFGVEAEATAELTVLPPAPERVSRTLALEVPSQLALSVRGTSAAGAHFLQRLSGEAALDGGAGTLSYALGLRDLVEVEELRFLLERTRFGTTLGDLRLPLSDLLVLAGRGLRFTAKAGPAPESPTRVTLAAVAAPAPGGRPLWLGGRGALQLGMWLPSLAVQFRPNPEALLASVTLETLQPVGGFGDLAATGAWSFEPGAGREDRAFLVRNRLRLGPFEAVGEVLRVGTDFPEARADESGVRFVQRWGFPRGGVVQGLFERIQNNVQGDPAVPTVIDTRAVVSARLPLDPLPTLSFQVDARTRTHPAPPLVTDLQDVGVEVRLAQPAGPLTFALTHRRDRARDLVAGTDTERLTWRWDADLRLRPLRALFRVELETLRDPLQDLVLNRTLGALVSTRIALPPASLSLTLERFADEVELAAALEVEMGRLSVSTGSALRRDASGAFRLSFGFAAALLFEVPVPFLPTKGQLEGFVFVDEDRDGVRDPGEPGVPNLVLTLDGLRARTDPRGSGFFRFPPREPGVYELAIEDLPAGLTSFLPLPQRVEIRAGEVRRLDLPVGRVAAVRGAVFLDGDADGVRDPGEPGLPGVRVLAFGPEGLRRTALTGDDGGFALPGLVPGPWRIVLDVQSLPERHEPTTPTEVRLELASGEVAEVAFGVREVPPVVRFSPTAEFTVTPERPRAGEVVTFDASASFDVDGRIVAYVWDFDGDGSPDAEGVVVEHVFAEPGTYDVTLTVTDDDGLEGRRTRTVEVLPP